MSRCARRHSASDAKCVCPNRFVLDDISGKIDRDVEQHDDYNGLFKFMLYIALFLLVVALQKSMTMGDGNGRTPTDLYNSIYNQIFELNGQVRRWTGQCLCRRGSNGGLGVKSKGGGSVASLLSLRCFRPPVRPIRLAGAATRRATADRTATARRPRPPPPEPPSRLRRRSRIVARWATPSTA